MRFITLKLDLKLLTLIPLAVFIQACSLQSSSDPTPHEKSSTYKGVTSIRLVSGGYNGLGSKGIYSFSLDTKTLMFTEPEILMATNNSSFMLSTDDNLYAVQEIADGQINAFNVQTENLNLLSQVSSEGASPCYLSVSPNKRFMAAANFMGGNASILSIDKTGAILDAHQILQDATLPDTERPLARAHWVGWSKDSQWIYVVYHGSDKIMAYPFNTETGKSGEGHPAIALPQGDGPRLMALHPSKNLAYIVSQTSDMMTVASIMEDGTFEIMQRLSTLPDGFNGDNSAAHIAISKNGKYVYASNRGHNSIVVFSTNETGLLTKIQTISSGGDRPRFFLVLDELNLLLVANRDSHQIKVFKIEPDGTLETTEHDLNIPGPTYIGRLGDA